MNDQVRGGVIKLALAGGILYLWVTGALSTKLIPQLTGAVSGAPVAQPYPFRKTLAAHAASSRA